jgi:hypothetical protein
MYIGLATDADGISGGGCYPFCETVLLQLHLRPTAANNDYAVESPVTTYSGPVCRR